MTTKWMTVSVPAKHRESFRKSLEARARFRVEDDPAGARIALEEVYSKRPINYFNLIELSDPGKVSKQGMNQAVAWLRKNPHACVMRKPYDYSAFKKEIEAVGRDKLQDFLRRIDQILFTCAVDQLPAEVDFIAQQLARVLPGSKLFLVTTEEVLLPREALIRGLFALSKFPEIFDNPEKFDGFNTLKKLHVDGTSGLHTYLRCGLNILAPHMLGYASNGFNSSFVILFDSPIDYRTNFPAVPLDAFRVDSTFMMEHRDSDDNDTRFDLKAKVNLADSEAFLRWYVYALNTFMAFLTDPQNYGEASNPTNLDPDLWHQSMLFINRAFIEVGVIQTSINRAEFTRKVMFFSLLDQLARLVRATTNPPVSDAETFKKMLRQSFGQGRLIGGLGVIPDPMKTILIERVKEAYRSIYDVATAGIFVDGCLVAGRVKINNGASHTDQSVEEYVVDLLRNIRNTHHGYFVQESSECPMRLAVHDGNTSDLLSELGPLWLLGLISNPDWFLAGKL